jgi:hypothetical protein
MTRYNQTVSRAEFVRQRRTSRTPNRSAAKKPAAPSVRRVSTTASLFLPVEPRVDPRRTQARTVAGTRQRYDAVFTVSKTRVHTPGITLPQFNIRWVSALLTAVLLFVLYTLWTSSTFIVTGAEITGNQRLGAAEIFASLHLTGKPIFSAVPAQMEADLRAAYPDLSAVRVRVAFPNRVIVEVIERTPILAWYQNGAMGWIDASGVAFPPRGAADGLINVVASGTPPQVPDAALPVYEQAYVPPGMVQALAALYPYVPAGVPMIYDPQYGMGWQDPRGWQVFFGHTTDDIALKVQMYQSIVDTLAREGRQPTLISLAYLDAPFYK